MENLRRRTMSVLRGLTSGLVVTRPRSHLLVLRSPCILFASTSTQKKRRFIENVIRYKKSFVALGVTGTAMLGFAMTTDSETNVPEDVRDLKALSKVPFGKLCSGWV